MKQLKKSQRIIAGCLAAGCILGCTSRVYADSEWDDDKKEEAWAVYTTTEWNDIANLNFSIGSDGSISQADVNATYRAIYEPYIDKVLEDSSFTTIFYGADSTRDKSPYKELMLAISYTLFKRGEGYDGILGLLTPESYNDGALQDPCHIHDFFNPNLKVDSTEDSFRWLFFYLTQSENYYSRNQSEAMGAYSIYNTNENLSVVIQGILYRTSNKAYSKENATYSTDSASAFYEENKNNMVLSSSWNDFAEDVLDKYSAIMSTQDRTVVG